MSVGRLHQPALYSRSQVNILIAYVNHWHRGVSTRGCPAAPAASAVRQLVVVNTAQGQG
eukprot:COSAG01_NODE_53523_length_338_cov_1.958159_1_plen_58_part_01